MKSKARTAVKAEMALALAWGPRLPVSPRELATRLEVFKGCETRTIAFMPIDTVPYSGHVSYDANSHTYRCRFHVQEEPTRQRFVQAHLLGHVLLGHVKRIDLPPDTHFRIKEPSRVEREANEFAAALLMPEEMLRVAVHRHPCVERLARLFGVSTNAIHQRLVNLGILP